MKKKRKPLHPGVILDEHYIKPLNLNLEKIADCLGLPRNTLFRIRSGRARVSVSIALSLAKAFDTTPQLWLNLQQKYDLWEKEKTHKRVAPIVKNGKLIPKYAQSNLTTKK